eukprot:CAMPEP_0172507312 /NCGR_PEP_ID=MMETSP1066-20121228/202770_1 /TAXON_ID=671091 /ORGANISM="Coscinodiscus wailesii, Strain CCMP2513" /LENGTH=242 /DNA_ID=CAMNT_0013284817 /DNA_START=329 /DNA_END=1060 /DNA_ORIENTATION=-
MTGETFNLRQDSNAGNYILNNGLGTSSVQSVTQPSTNVWNVQIDDDSFIVFSGWSGGLSVQVVGMGNIFSGSEGMFGSWDYGGVRFPNGYLFDTSQGYTSPGAIALAEAWQVPLPDSLMFEPSNICDASSSCGPGHVFLCTDVRRTLRGRKYFIDEKKKKPYEVVDSDCSGDCSDISPAFLREACEIDIVRTGDKSFACEPSKLNPLIKVPGPGDFIPHPMDSPKDNDLVYIDVKRKRKPGN